jgi:hypothetical protein
MYSKKINQLATNLNPQNTDLLPIGDATTGQLKTTTYGALSGITEDGVISGGIVTWTGTGLIFNISACIYILNGIRYSSPFSTKTLAAADPTNARIDVFAVNTSSQVVVIQGTPAVNPIEPEGDLETTLGLTNVTINAGATTPNGVTRDLIYDENASSPTEWSHSSDGISGYTVNFADTTQFYTGTKSIKVTKTNYYVNTTYLKGSTINTSTYQSLTFAIRIVNNWNFPTETFILRFYNGTTLVASFNITQSNTIGFVPTIINQWQLLTIPLSSITFSQNIFNQIAIYTGGGTNTYWLDTIKLNGGINNPSGSTSTNSFGFVNGNTGTATATTATDTLSIVGSGLISTSATGKTLTISLPASGTTNYVTKYTPNGTSLGNSLIFDNGTSVGIGTASPSSANLLQVEGVIGANTTKTYAGGSTLSANVGSIQGAVSYSFGGNVTIPNSIVTSANLASTNFTFTSTGTVTQNQSGGIRAIANMFSQLQFTGSVSGTITHVANIRGAAPYSVSSATLTISNYYGLLLENSATFAPIVATNRWGIYQEGASDGNYFAGDLTFNKLAGTGTRNIVADANGLLSTQTGTQSTALLDVFTSSLKGLAPASGGGTTNFLRADGTWASAGGTNIYNSDGTLTSARTLTSGGFNLTFTGSNTAATGIARGILLNQTLIASSNYDYLIGLDINNTFTNGAFTNVLNVGIRAKGSYLQVPNTEGLQIGFFSGNTPTTQSNIAITNSGTGGSGTYQVFPVMTGQRNIFIVGTTIPSGLGSPTISGNDNIIIGKASIGNPHSGTYNTLINTGNVSLSSGAGNTGIGPYALRGITTGSNNIHITSNGGAGNGTFGTAISNTIFIGDPVKTNNNTTIAGDIVICTPYSIGNVFWFGGKSDSADVVFNIPTRAGSTNAAGHTSTTRAGIATGTGEAGKIVFQHSTPVASGSTLQSAFTDTLSLERLKIYTPSTVSVIIGGNTANASALLQVDSTAQGFLPPRMTTTQKNAIGTPAAGLIVYDTTLNKLCLRTASAWETITSI